MLWTIVIDFQIITACHGGMFVMDPYNAHMAWRKWTAYGGSVQVI